VNIKAGLRLGLSQIARFSRTATRSRKKTISRTEKPQKFLSVREYNLIKMIYEADSSLLFPRSKHDFTSYYTTVKVSV